MATLYDGIKAFNRNSGEQIWHFSLEDKSENPSKYSPRIWSGFSFDAELNVYYVVAGDPAGLIGIKRTKNLFRKCFRNGRISKTFPKNET